MAPSDNYQATISQLLKKVACDKPLLKLLANSYDPASQDQFTKALYDLLPAEAESVLKDPWNACMTYCMDNPDDVPIHLSAALDAKKQGLKAYRHRRGHFLDAVGITQKQQGTKLAGVPTISLNRLRKPYPPSGHDIYESPSAHKIWKKHRKTTPYPDSRYTWKPFHSLNPARLQHIVRGNESAIIRDSRNNELVGLVIRNFTDQNPRLLAWVNNIIMENIEVRKSVRLEDPGKLCQIGYTAGSRSNPQLGWARNLLWKQTDVAKNRLMYESSSVFALVWNILRNQLPGEVNGSFEKWLQEEEMVRMDTVGSQDMVKGTYAVKYGDETYEFHGVEMAPPSGVFGTNYTRFIHREGSPHKYAVSWTTMREPELDATAGGHFFICQYGVKVEAAADSVVVWNPKSWHGTSLQRRDPSNPAVFQAGLSIVTPTGIAKLWREVLDEKISLEEAREKMLELESEEQA